MICMDSYKGFWTLLASTPMLSHCKCVQTSLQRLYGLSQSMLKIYKLKLHNASQFNGEYTENQIL